MVLKAALRRASSKLAKRACSKLTSTETVFLYACEKHARAVESYLLSFLSCTTKAERFFVHLELLPSIQITLLE